MKIKLAIAAFALSVHLIPNYAAAQNSAVEGDPYAALYDVMVAPQNGSQVNARILAQARDALETDPNVRELELDCPGTTDVMFAVFTKYAPMYDEAEQAQKRIAITKLFRDNFTTEQAVAAAEFYGSPVGRKLLLAAVNNYTLSNTLTTVVKDVQAGGEGAVSEKSYASDLKQSAMAGAATLSADDLAEIGRQVQGKEWFAAITKIRPQIYQMVVQIANSDFAPDVDKLVDRDLDAALDKHLMQCDY